MTETAHLHAQDIRNCSDCQRSAFSTPLLSRGAMLLVLLLTKACCAGCGVLPFAHSAVPTLDAATTNRAPFCEERVVVSRGCIPERHGLVPVSSSASSSFHRAHLCRGSAKGQGKAQNMALRGGSMRGLIDPGPHGRTDSYEDLPREHRTGGSNSFDDLRELIPEEHGSEDDITHAESEEARRKEEFARLKENLPGYDASVRFPLLSQ